MPTRVINIRTKAQYDVYIGRTNRFHPDLYQDQGFGNPFKGDDAIPRFRAYFIEKVRSDGAFREQVLALKGKTLGCWCEGRNRGGFCHGDVIVDWLDRQP